MLLKYLFLAPSSKGLPGQRWLDVPQDAEVFTYHRKNAGRALLAGLIVGSVFEATAVHVLISVWSHWAALAATFASAYFGFQVLAQIRAIGMRPMYVHQGRLAMRNGAFELADIALSQIESIARSTKEVEPESGSLPPLNVGFPANHNVVIRLKQPADATVMNLKKRQFQTALLAIDDSERFVGTIQKQIS